MQFDVPLGYITLYSYRVLLVIKIIYIPMGYRFSYKANVRSSFAINKWEYVIENKTKFWTFWSGKFARNKDIEPHQYFAHSYKNYSRNQKNYKNKNNLL